MIDQAGQQSAQAPIKLFAAMESRYQGLQSQIDRLQAAQVEEERRRVSNVTMMGVGILIGIALVGVMVAILAFGAWAGG